jgi:hypothetical protein
MFWVVVAFAIFNGPFLVLFFGHAFANRQELKESLKRSLSAPIDTPAETVVISDSRL